MDLLDSIRREIDARLEELRPFADEARHLQQARDALGEQPASKARRGSVQRTARERSRSSRGDAASRIIAHVAANPGATAGETASTLGLKRTSVSTRLTQLAKQGRLVKLSRGYTVP